MSKAYAEALEKKNEPIPQSKKLPGTKQKRNNAGGFSWKISCWQQVDRFLILGAENGTAYTTANKLIENNLKVIDKCMKQDPVRLIDRVVEISVSGRAPSKDPLLFTLAYIGGSTNDVAIKRRVYLSALHKVAEIGTDILHFAEYTKHVRGWGRLVRRGIAKWYESRTFGNLAYQVIKYRQRDGWSHRDLLRKAHPNAPTPEHKTIYEWICRGNPGETEVSPILVAANKAIVGTDVVETAGLIKAHNLPREVVNPDLLNDTRVWEALLERMPMMATVRNLAKLSSLGMVAPMSRHTKDICIRLTNPEAVQRSKVHPIAFLMAMRAYERGQGLLGHLTWTPVPQVVDALSEAFFLAFKNVTPMGGNVRLCLDISGSMAASFIKNSLLSARDATAALALVTARVESDYQIVGFCDKLKLLNITAKSSLQEAIRVVSNLPFGGTDCALPMLDAQLNQMDFDTFVVYTDNETWCGKIHPSVALKNYVERRGKESRLAVNGMTATAFSIAEPDNPLMMDFVGFDTSTPELISMFARGEL